MKKIWWIMERKNLGTFYVACGQMTKTQAGKLTRPTYGENIMHSFETEAAYKARLAELREKGERVQQ